MLSISQLCEMYLAWAPSYYRHATTGEPTRTINNIREALKALKETPDPTPAPGLLWAEGNRTLGELPAEQMTSPMLAAVRQRQIDQGLARRTVNGRIAWIQAMFAWAADAERKLIEARVYGELSLIKPLKRGRSAAREPEPKRAVPIEEVRATALFCSELVASLIWVQWWTGMRPAEACAMRKSEIDREHPAGVWIYRPGHFKSKHHAGKTRVVVIGPKGQEVVKARWDAVRGDVLFPGGRHESTGKPIERQSYGNAIRRVQFAYGLERWCPQQLRKSAADRAELKFGEEGAKIILDHTDIKVTREFYLSDPNLAKKIEMMRELG